MLDRTAAEGIARAGVAALQRGDGKEAQQRFTELVEAGHATAAMRLMLARACRASGDFATEAQTLDSLLELEPNNLRALLMRGQAFERDGDARAAVSFYQKAVGLAGPSAPLPDLAAELDAARAALARRASEFAELLEAALAERGLSCERRLRDALEIATGRRQVHHQQPSAFYFPYLAQRQFWEREEFDWVPALEAGTAEIKRELLDVIAAGADFEPYVQAEEHRPKRDFHGMLGDSSWTALYLWKEGRPTEQSSRFPRTMAALEGVPLSRIGSRTPAALFSRLTPGAHIPPHHGMLNTRLICHLPLIVPEGCWLRVGSETRRWEEGKMLIFDDSMLHEAKNESAETRIILLFDIWKPELSEKERAGVSAIFDAIDGFSGVAED